MRLPDELSTPIACDRVLTVANMRMAVAQSRADLKGVEERIAYLGQLLPEVVQFGADLLLLPELFVCGYNISAEIPTVAEYRDGPTSVAIAQLARQHAIAIHYGYAERAKGKIFNSALCIGPDGATLGHHRKLAIPPGFERELFSPGKGCQTFKYCGFNVATLICYDAEFSETVRHVAGLGADLVLVPTALGRAWGWVAEKMIPTRAFENGVYLAYSNIAGVENDMAFLGRSFIAAPDGTELARAGHGPEVLFADLDLAEVAKSQARLPYLSDRHDLQMT